MKLGKTAFESYNLMKKVSDEHIFFQFKFFQNGRENVEEDAHQGALPSQKLMTISKKSVICFELSLG